MGVLEGYTSDETSASYYRNRRAYSDTSEEGAYQSKEYPETWREYLEPMDEGEEFVRDGVSLTGDKKTVGDGKGHELQYTEYYGEQCGERWSSPSQSEMETVRNPVTER